MYVIWALDAVFVYALIYALSLCTCVKERKASLNLRNWFYIWSYKHQFSADVEFWLEGYWVSDSGT